MKTGHFTVLIIFVLYFIFIPWEELIPSSNKRTYSNVWKVDSGAGPEVRAALAQALWTLKKFICVSNKVYLSLIENVREREPVCGRRVRPQTGLSIFHILLVGIYVLLFYLYLYSFYIIIFDYVFYSVQFLLFWLSETEMRR